MARLSFVVLVGAVLASATQLAWARGFNPDPVFPVGAISDTSSHQVTKLDHVASVLAGRKAIVNCWSVRDWTRFQAWSGAHHNTALVDASGVTWERTHRIELSPFVCQVLAQVLARSARQPLFTAFAVTVLAHESAHASGIRSENRAECQAIETEPRAAELLGIRRATGQRLQHIYRGTIYPNDELRYRTPACGAGLPGQVVPDTLGTEADLRRFEQAARQIARIFGAWKNIGGSAGPLGPCGLVTNRSEELARFEEVFLGPHHEVVRYTGTTVKTKRDFSTALKLSKTLARCDLRWRRTQDRELHSSATETLGEVPVALKRLSRRLTAFRVIYVSGRKWNSDRIHVFDTSRRTWLELYISAPAGKLPLRVELRAARALIQAPG